jgi:hypothetical protein
MLDDGSPKTNNWDSLRISHCLELSLAETPKNESLLIVASHFSSNETNIRLLMTSLICAYESSLF